MRLDGTKINQHKPDNSPISKSIVIFDRHDAFIGTARASVWKGCKDCFEKYLQNLFQEAFLKLSSKTF